MQKAVHIYTRTIHFADVCRNRFLGGGGVIGKPFKKFELPQAASLFARQPVVGVSLCATAHARTAREGRPTPAATAPPSSERAADPLRRTTNTRARRNERASQGQMSVPSISRQTLQQPRRLLCWPVTRGGRYALSRVSRAQVYLASKSINPM